MLIHEYAVKSIMTRSKIPGSDFAANPYVGCPHGCRYCYAVFMKRITGHEEPWGTFLDVKYWEPLQRVEKYAGKSIFIASATDAYNPLEARFKRTQALLQELSTSGAHITLTTKSDLILRDIELLKKIPDLTAVFSVNTLSERFRVDMDKAVPIVRRLEAMEKLHRSGIRTVTFISPVFPVLSDVKRILERVRGICDEIWIENLNLRSDYLSDILNYIQNRHPGLYPLYRDIYIKGDLNYWRNLREEIKIWSRALGVPVTDCFHDDRAGGRF